MEAKLVGVHEKMPQTDSEGGEDLGFVALEVVVLRTQVHEAIRMEGFLNRVDPEKWKPMIITFSRIVRLEGEEGE